MIQLPSTPPPDPMGYQASKVDASRLLEPNDSTSTETNTLQQIRGRSALSCCTTTSAAPKRPPGSVVGGFGMPELSTIWTASSPSIRVVQSVEFNVVQKALECHLRFLAMQRPPRLAEFMSEEEWTGLQRRMDEIGYRIRWDVNRSFILLILLFVIVITINLGDEIGGNFKLGDLQEVILIVFGVILAKLLFDECYENVTRRHVLHEMDEACKQFSDLLRPRGICVAFRFEDHDDHGLVVDLLFYRVKALEYAC